MRRRQPLCLSRASHRPCGPFSRTRLRQRFCSCGPYFIDSAGSFVDWTFEQQLSCFEADAVFVQGELRANEYVKDAVTIPAVSIAAGHLRKTDFSIFSKADTPEAATNGS